MRKRRRFKSEAQIIGAIDRLKATMLRGRLEAEARDEMADEVFHSPGPHEPTALAVAKANRAKAALLRRTQERHERQMRRLKETLAAFTTAPMPFLNDQSVPLSRL